MGSNPLSSVTGTHLFSEDVPRTGAVAQALRLCVSFVHCGSAFLEPLLVHLLHGVCKPPPMSAPERTPNLPVLLSVDVTVTSAQFSNQFFWIFFVLIRGLLVFFATSRDLTELPHLHWTETCPADQKLYFLVAFLRRRNVIKNSLIFSSGFCPKLSKCNDFVIHLLYKTASSQLSEVGVT